MRVRTIASGSLNAKTFSSPLCSWRCILPSYASAEGLPYPAGLWDIGDVFLQMSTPCPVLETQIGFQFSLCLRLCVCVVARLLPLAHSLSNNQQAFTRGSASAANQLPGHLTLAGPGHTPISELPLAPCPVVRPDSRSVQKPVSMGIKSQALIFYETRSL